jgi:hypothetical protein
VRRGSATRSSTRILGSNDVKGFWKTTCISRRGPAAPATTVGSRPRNRIEPAGRLVQAQEQPPERGLTREPTCRLPQDRPGQTWTETSSTARTYRRVRVSHPGSRVLDEMRVSSNGWRVAHSTTSCARECRRVSRSTARARGPLRGS